MNLNFSFYYIMHNKLLAAVFTCDNNENKINSKDLKKEFFKSNEKIYSPFSRTPLEDITNMVTDEKAATIYPSRPKHKTKEDCTSLKYKETLNKSKGDSDLVKKYKLI